MGMWQKIKTDLFTEELCFDAVLVACIFIALFAVVAGIFSHSHALALEGAFCTIDVIASVATIYIFKLVNSKGSEKYPFGYFKLEPLSIAIQSAMTLASCFLGALHAVKDLVHEGSYIKSYGWSFSYMIFTLLLSAVFYVYITIVNNKSPSNLLELEKVTWKNGAFFTLGLFIGFIISYVLEQIPDPRFNKWAGYVDPSLTIIVVCCVFKAPYQLFKTSFFELLDVKPSESVLDTEIFGIIQRYASELNLDVSNERLKLRKAGRVFFGVVSYRADSKTTLEQINQLNEAIKMAAREKYSNLYLDLAPTLVPESFDSI